MVIFVPCTGNWVNALRAILKSVYGYFSYDIDSYIASKLDLPTRSRAASSDMEEGDSNEDSGDELEEGSSEADQGVSEQTARRSSIIRNMPPKLHKTPSNKAISSFTVENILMGKQSPNSSTSTSSHSPTSSAAASLPSPTTPFGPMSSSVVGVNWVSHPPVKYTKFTILSPTAMSDEAKKKKSSEASPQSASARSEESTEMRYTTPTTAATAGYHNSKHLSQVVYARQTSSEASMTSTPVYSLSSLSASPTVKQLPTSPAPHTSSAAKICTLPVLSKSFPPSQQYVLLVPSSSAAVTSAVQSVPQVSLLPSPSVGNGMKRSHIKTVSFQSPPVATSTASGSNSGSYSGGSGGRLERPSFNHSNEYNFRLIAPKQKHRMSVNSTNAKGRSKLRGRAPQKLRFHMTTVVTKQKKVPVKSSMTVESPSVAVVRNPNAAGRINHSRSSESSLPVESMITRSPNVYSSVPSKPVKEEVPDLESYTSAGGRAPSQNSTKLSIHNGDSPSTSYRTGSTEDLHAAGVRRNNSSLPVDQQSREPVGTRHRGRATRSYTRRKRELTFHLYEDPGTAFRAKRACKE